MPIEVNQRVGGSEVDCLVATVSGVDMGIAAIKVACGIELPNYVTLLPEGEYMNRLGWDRVPGGLALCDPQTRASYPPEAGAEAGARAAALANAHAHRHDNAAAASAASTANTAEAEVEAEALKSVVAVDPDAEYAAAVLLPAPEPTAAAAAAAVAAAAEAVSATADNNSSVFTKEGLPIPGRAVSWSQYLGQRYAHAAKHVTAAASAESSCEKAADYVYVLSDVTPAAPAFAKLAAETPVSAPLHLALPCPKLLALSSGLAASAAPAASGAAAPAAPTAAAAAAAQAESLASLLALARAAGDACGLGRPTATLPPGPARRYRFVSSINFVPAVTGVIKVLHMPAEALNDPAYISSGMWYNVRNFVN